MSTRIEAAIANAKAAPRETVKVVVWVMKPGPMAEVAIRNIAPISVDLVLAFIAVSGVFLPAAGGNCSPAGPVLRVVGRRAGFEVGFVRGFDMAGLLGFEQAVGRVSCRRSVGV